MTHHGTRKLRLVSMGGATLPPLLGPVHGIDKRAGSTAGCCGLLAADVCFRRTQVHASFLLRWKGCKSISLSLLVNPFLALLFFLYAHKNIYNQIAI